VTGQLRAELLKQRSTPTTLLLFLAMFGLVALASGLHVLAPSISDLSSRGHQLEVFEVGTRVGMLFAGLVGAIAVTAEIPKKALALATAMAKPLVYDTVGSSRKNRLHVVGGPFGGCPSTNTFSIPGKGECFRFLVRGDAVPIQRIPGFGSIAFGTYYITITYRGTPKVRAIAFGGGGRMVKLAGSDR
jgi:hypothetical protein